MVDSPPSIRPVRVRLSLALVVALLTVACTGTPREGATGEEIFMQLCARCHSSDLSGGIGPALGPGSDAAGRPDEFLRLTITRGRGRMPSFGMTLTDEQVDAVIAYLREQQER